MRGSQMDSLKKHLLKASKISMTAFVTLSISSTATASDGNRITVLEREIHELKIRLLKLENPQANVVPSQRATLATDGWTNKAAWRSLKSGMSYEEVRTVLGEPDRINGGTLAFWYYPNRGTVAFQGDKLTSWQEPR